mmetsp:Transcript_17830/g.27563  ORF Transcript_17830/g.27563 Transcript_17830/m.27563 type:complete len:233 (-) Transcript_17830:1248-1946(-)
MVGKVDHFLNFFVVALVALHSIEGSPMTNFACNTTSQIISDQGLTITDEPDKVPFFCKDYVQYTVACDLDDDPQVGFNPSCNNTFAIQVFSNFQRALSVYSCNEYSRIWKCVNCTAAYKRWLCGALFRRCKSNDTSVSGGRCESNFTRTNAKALPDCVMKTCQDVCYDVVRKCPVHLDFRCPPEKDLREYNHSDCNNLERPSTQASGTQLGAGILQVILVAFSSWLASQTMY